VSSALYVAINRALILGPEEGIEKKSFARRSLVPFTIFAAIFQVGGKSAE
jgi:hypothetical protein